MNRFIASIIIIAISPLIAFAVLLVFIEDGFPLIFRQKRIGIYGKEFTIFKIRTMKKDTPSVATHNLEKHYVLRSGSILRKLKIDEFPQLLNVIMGDMNFFGSRPGLTSQVELKRLRQFEGVLLNKPGVTGLAQVCGYDMSDPYKLSKIDNLYNKRKNLFMDIKILLATISFLCRKDLKKFIVENTDV